MKGGCQGGGGDKCMGNGRFVRIGEDELAVQGLGPRRYEHLSLTVNNNNNNNSNEKISIN